MSNVKNISYRHNPFSIETPKDEFYTFSSVAKLVAKSEMYKDDIFHCRTVGILHSAEGRFYLTDIDTPTIKSDEPILRVTMVYMKCPVQTAGVPFPVQVFGTMHWKNRPVIFIKILQVLNTPMAVRLRDTLSMIVEDHLASPHHEEEFDDSIPDLNDTFVFETTP